MNWSVVHILGNGPSANGLSLDFFDDKNLVVINRGALRYPFAGTLFSLDREWIRNNRWLINNFNGEVYLALPEKLPGCQELAAHYLGWSNADGLSDDPKTVCTGCNSGYAVINLAYLKGAKEIHLWGYDMDPKDNDQYQFWIKAFDTMIPQLNARGIKVLNHNLNSHITAFEKAT